MALANHIHSTLKAATSDLISALAATEQKCQEIRWRVANFPGREGITDLETEMGTLAGQVSEVAVSFGKLEALIQIEVDDRD